MKKKIIALLLALTLVLSATACGAQSATDTITQNDSSTEQTDSTNESSNVQTEETTDANASTEQTENTVEPETLEVLEADVMKDVENSISALQSEMDTLVAEITTFDKYVENVDRMEAFYTKASTDSLQLEICLMEHAVTYAEFIMNSNNDFDDKYDDLDELYDVVYEDAGDKFYDGIYDGILEDMYDIFYDELLDDAYDSVPYEKWLDARSNEYEWWLDARSDCYEILLDTRSDIYEFWLNLRSAAFEKDAEEVTEIIDDFKEDIIDLRTDLQK